VRGSNKKLKNWIVSMVSENFDTWLSCPKLEGERCGRERSGRERKEDPSTVMQCFSGKKKRVINEGSHEGSHEATFSTILHYEDKFFFALRAVAFIMKAFFFSHAVKWTNEKHLYWLVETSMQCMALITLRVSPQRFDSSHEELFDFPHEKLFDFPCEELFDFPFRTSWFSLRRIFWFSLRRISWFSPRRTVWFPRRTVCFFPRINFFLEEILDFPFEEFLISTFEELFDFEFFDFPLWPFC